MSDHHHHHQLQPQVITRTRQDLINSGELFRMNGKLSREQSTEDNQIVQSDGRSRDRLESPTVVRKSHLTECCFSVSNLALIIATVVALTTLIRFFRDEPLDDYYEYLLSLHFYRQMIYVTVILPLVLLLPIFNALSVLLFINKSTNTAKKQQSSQSANSRALSKVKLFYQAILMVLIFLALIFVGPYVQSSNLTSQIELELRKFMRNRYESEFAYQLLDRIQERYECCDHMWYRANLKDQLPLSCFVAGTNFRLFFERSCSYAIGSIIGTRCYIIAGCLVVILISLASLFSIDLTDSLGRQSNGRYEINNTPPNGVNSQQQPPTSIKTYIDAEPTTTKTSDTQNQKLLSGNEQDGGCLHRETSISDRLKLDERERNVPLLQQRDTEITDEHHQHDDDFDFENNSNQPAASRIISDRTTFGTNKQGPIRLNQPIATNTADKDSLTARSQSSALIDPCQTPKTTDPILLARAHYQLIKRERSQSPKFVPSPDVTSHLDEVDGNQQALLDTSNRSTGSSPSGQDQQATSNVQKPIKSVLKKTTSNSSNIDDHESSRPARFGSFEDPSRNDSFFSSQSDDDDDDDDDDDYIERLRQSDSLLRQKQIQREQLTRRSLLSVRFADE